MTVAFARTAAYDLEASRYTSSVYTRQRLDLLSKLHSSLLPLFVSHLKNLHKSLLRSFRLEIEAALQSEGYDFGRVVKEARERVEREFKEKTESVVLEESEWSAEEQGTQLGEDMDAVAELLRKEETRKMVAVIEVRSPSFLCCPSLFPASPQATANARSGTPFRTRN